MTATLLDRSLCILKGISPATECVLQRRGVLTTKQLATAAHSLFSSKHASQLTASFLRIEKARQLGLLDSLVNSLPIGHRVRVVHDFLPFTAFLDIETDAVAASSRITCISVLMNGQLATFIRDQNLDDFLCLWAKCRIVVTFNGKRFDIPKILREFGLSTTPAHIDLIDEARHYGFRGGLKKIAGAIGWSPRDDNQHSGLDAVAWWNKYLDTGDTDLLAQLVVYNQDDVLALDHLYRKVLKLSVENMQLAP